MILPCLNFLSSLSDNQVDIMAIFVFFGIVYFVRSGDTRQMLYLNFVVFLSLSLVLYVNSLYPFLHAQEFLPRHNNPSKFLEAIEQSRLINPNQLTESHFIAITSNEPIDSHPISSMHPLYQRLVAVVFSILTYLNYYSLRHPLSFNATYLAFSASTLLLLQLLIETFVFLDLTRDVMMPVGGMFTLNLVFLARGRIAILSVHTQFADDKM